MRLPFVVTALLALAAIADAQVTINSDLGTLTPGTYTLFGDTRFATNEFNSYTPVTSTTPRWLEDYIFEFEITESMSYQLSRQNVDDFSIPSQPHFFLLSSLDSTVDGDRVIANDIVAYDPMTDIDSLGTVWNIPAGTYYVVADEWTIPGREDLSTPAFEFELEMILEPTTFSDLGTMQLDAGLFDGDDDGNFTEPFGELQPFTVDADGEYDISVTWSSEGDETVDIYLYVFDEPFDQKTFNSVAGSKDTDRFIDTPITRLFDADLVAGTTYYLVAASLDTVVPADLIGEVSLAGPGVATLAQAVSGDFNGDGSVDVADYTVWRDNYGSADESSLNGAGDGSNGVDIADYQLWKANFGEPSTSAPVQTPEPATCLLLIFTAGMYCRRR